MFIYFFFLKAKETADEESAQTQEDDRLDSSLLTDQFDENADAVDEVMPEERAVGKSHKNGTRSENPLNGGRKVLRGNKKSAKQSGGKRGKLIKKADKAGKQKHSVQLHRNDKRAGHAKVAKKGGSNQGPFSFLLPVFKQVYCTLSTFVPSSLLDSLLGPLFKYLILILL